MLQSWWKRKVDFLFSQIDEYVQHTFREHNQDADHWPNLGAEGQRTIVVYRENNNEKWKASRGWDVSSTCDGEK